MSVLILLALVTSFYPLCAAVDCGGKPLKSREDKFQPLCSRSCKNTSEIIPRGTFSKYQCSCSQSCFVYNDCCYDSPYRRPEERKTSRKEFVCISVTGRGRYKAVSSCSELGWHPLFFRGNLSLSPVTSRVTNLTYVNIHYALCNEDAENMTTWNVKLSCPPENKDQIEDLRDYESQVTYSQEDFYRVYKDRPAQRCEFREFGEDFARVKGLELRSCGSTDWKSRCSKSWRKKATEKKCKSYVDPVYHHNKAYRNSHCARCNFVNLTDVDCLPDVAKRKLQQKTLSPEEVERCMIEICDLNLGKGSKHRKRIMVPTGSHQLLTYMFKDPCQTAAFKQCCEGKRYDENTSKCRRVTQ